MIKRQKIKYSKINSIIQNYPKGLVLTSDYLVKQGFSLSLQQRYRKSSWLTSLGKGAMLREGDPFSLTGAIMALQQQQNSDIHVGGAIALELHGNAHYLRLMFNSKVTLFTANKKTLPLWFLNTKWDSDFAIHNFSLFTDNTLGLSDFVNGELTTKISTRERAIMECLYLCPNKFSLTEAMELMGGLTSLRPDRISELLMKCTSVKVKRLFLYLAEQSDWGWFKFLDTSRIDLGTGVRSLSKSGEENFYSKKYQLILPQTLS